MSADHTPALLALLGAIDARIAAHDGTPMGSKLADQQLIVYGGTQTPENRRYQTGTPNRGAVWLVVCVSNTSTGARTLARLVTDALDGARIAGSMLRVRLVSTPIEDRDDPSEWRWSSTVEITHHT